MGQMNNFEQRENTSEKVKTVLSPRCVNCSGYEEKITLTQKSEELGEVAEMDKHEIISQIACYLGQDPACFNMAEDMFNSLKYQMAEYVLKHEFNCENDLSVQVTMWLEQKRSPELINPLESVISQYLRPQG